MDDKEDTREGTRQLLKGILEDLEHDEIARPDDRDEMRRRGESERPGSSEQTFGWGMLGLTLFTLLVGAYPVPVSIGTRAMFLFFAIVELFVAAYFLDKSRKLKRSREARSRDSRHLSQTAPRKGSLHRLK